MSKGQILWGVLCVALCSCVREQQVHTPSAVNVGVKRVERSAGVLERHYVGVVSEVQSASLGFTYGGVVSKVFVKEGDFVRAGDSLLAIDKSSAKHIYDIAHASYLQAKDGYDRAQMVHKQGGLTEIKWVEVQTALSKAEAAYKNAQKQLDDCSLLAPYDGYVAECSAQVGVNVAPMVGVVSLLSTSEVEVSFSVPEREVVATRVGQPLKLRVASLADREYHTTVYHKGMTAKTLSHTYSVKARLNNSDGALLPGMMCEVVMTDSVVAQGVTVPAEAVLLATDNSRFVWLAEPIDTLGHYVAVMRKVQIGGFAEGGVVVTEGLNEGEALVIEGYQKVSEGTQLNIK